MGPQAMYTAPYFLPIGVTFPPGHSSRRGSDSDFADKCCSYKKILPWLVCSISYRRQGPCVPGHILILYNLPYMLWLHVRPGRGKNLFVRPSFSFCFFFSKFPRHPLWSFVIGIIRQGISFTFQYLSACARLHRRDFQCTAMLSRNTYFGLFFHCFR